MGDIVSDSLDGRPENIRASSHPTDCGTFRDRRLLSSGKIHAGSGNCQTRTEVSGKEKIEAEEAEKRRIENERFSAIGRERFEAAIRKHGKPAALILAVEHEDVSELQADYLDFRTVRTIVLAFSKHTRNLFSEMRKAALNAELPEIRKLSHAPATWEHRENYTGGHGFYLAESKYCGWSIEKIPLYNDEQLKRFFCNAGKNGGFCVK